MDTVSGINHHWEDGGILTVVFDAPNERVNLLTPEILDELSRVLDQAKGHPDLRGLIFTSAKPGMFIAGMDVERIASVSDAQTGREAASYGQSVFQKIHMLKRPSICVIGGTCLGGGTELALACSMRIASDGDSVEIGLPEVRLGIIPGFGGTQRMPPLVGLTSSLDLILSGKSLNGKRAMKIGLVDGVVPAAYLEREARKLLRRAIDKGLESTVGAVRAQRPWLMKRAEGIAALRRYVMGQARKKTEAKADPRHYPAPFKAIEAIESAFSMPLDQGLDHEARLVGELIPSETTKNLIWLFKTQSSLKNQRTGLAAVPRKIRRMAVVGAGIMGGGIAQLAAHREIPVRMKDLNYDAVLSALATAGKVWGGQVKRRRLTRKAAADRMAFIAPTLDLTGMRHVDIVVEAVVEKLEVKQAVLAEMERVIDERAIFASNTSSLPISEIASRAHHPERVVGMHFFNPVHRMPLVEVIAGKRSSPEAIATVQALAIRMGKVPVIVKDGPGFLVNRILTFYMNEAMRALSDGVSIEDTDQAMKAFGMPMGPFELLDEVGLDTAMHVGDILRAGLGERVGGENDVLRQLVDSGRLGKKNGKGLYQYRDGKRTQPDPDIQSLVGIGEKRELPPETLQERMVLAMVNEASYCLEEAVVRQARDVDIAMVMGTGFPPFRGGLLRHADSVGVPVIVDRLSRLAGAHGERFSPSRLLQSMVREQQRFYS
jgi:3-hydroxyacyl-CoA dehydrogenase/enoyl-CoA hydratase/3-hydroxybutyryl-CoA epimerase